MPRKASIDVFGALNHLMVRGIERKRGEQITESEQLELLETRKL